MATDIEAILRNLLASYDFTDKVLVSVGAGGGQFVGYAHAARRVVAIDNDPAAIARLAARLAALKLEDKFELVTGDFYTAPARGDVVLFEFSLHEMPDPALAISRAREIAPEVVIIDHYPGSPWAFQAAEEGKVERSWEVIRRQQPRLVRTFEAIQLFPRYQDLVDKISCQGAVALERAQPFAAARDITFRAPYAVAVL